MKFSILFTTFFFFQLLFAQQKLVKDIDFDGMNDTIKIHRNEGQITVRLSSNDFKEEHSGSIEFLDGTANLVSTKKGFALNVDWMRAGFSYQFRFDKSSKKIQLIGMSRYEFGPANNDGRGKSSVNLITNKYVGDWHYYSIQKERLLKIPTIKTTMKFPKTFLENTSEEIYEAYEENCTNLYLKKKKELLKE